MPLIMETDNSDVEAVALELDAAEKALAEALESAGEDTISGDLTDGGHVSGASIYPAGQKEAFERGQAKGRPAAIRAWMWDGSPSTLTLRWNPDGDQHDGGRSYLTKKHCLCCGESGFRVRCRKCEKTGCGKCRASTVASQVIPCFYLRKDDVPFQHKFYGDIDCFLITCQRRGETGFQSTMDMYQHAASRHGKEWEAYQLSKQADKATEVDELRAKIDALTLALLEKSTAPAGTVGTLPITEKPERTPEQIQAVKDRMAKARAARKSKVTAQ